MRRLLVVLGIVALQATAAFAQEQRIIDNLNVNRGTLRLGAGVQLEMEGSTNDAFEMRFTVDPTADILLTWPATQGSAGQQLQTTAGGELSWASAASERDVKVMAGLLDPADALQAILAAPIHRFRYKPDQGTRDAQTEYAGIVADEAPWAMHFGGTILNPINTAGYTMGAIQALQAEIDALKAQLAAKPKPRRWYQFWRRR